MRFLLLIPSLGLLAGCPMPPVMTGFPAAPPLAAGGAQITTVTQVQLSQSNFRLVKADVAGTSTGFRLFGLLTFRSPDYAEAITRLYQKAGISNGKAQVFVNLVYDQSSRYFILFSLPKITVRGDLIEFGGGQP